MIEKKKKDYFSVEVYCSFYLSPSSSFLSSTSLSPSGHAKRKPCPFFLVSVLSLSMIPSLAVKSAVFFSHYLQTHVIYYLRGYLSCGTPSSLGRARTPLVISVQKGDFGLCPANARPQGILGRSIHATMNICIFPTCH